MKNKRILLIGTSFSALSLLKYLKKEGYYVCVCGGLKNDPCHSYADESFFIDYSKKEELLKLCEEESFEYIIPTCNDYSYNSASYVSWKLDKFHGFDKLSTTELLHTKNGFREFTIKNGFSVPRAVKYNDNLNFDNLKLDYPLLVKPDDSFSGKGVTKVFQKSELKKAVETAQINSKNKDVIIEEFIEGELFSHSAFVQNGKILIDFFVDEFCTVYPYQVDSSSLSFELSDKIKDELRYEISKLISLLDLKDGLLHTQFISDNKRFSLIETMRRCPGDLYGTLIKKSTGFNYGEFYCKPFLNEKNSIKNLKLFDKHIARHTISKNDDIIFESFSYDIPAKTVDIFPLKDSGQILKQAPFDKIGIVFCEFDTKEKLIEYTPRMKEFFFINKADGIIDEK